MKKQTFVLAVAALCAGLTGLITAADKPLTDQLREKAAASSANADPKRQRIMQKAIDDLEESKIVELAVKKGDTMPAFTLPDVKAEQVSSAELLKKGPLVVTFYRGGWCPYCNLQLADLQKHLPEIRAAGAQLVAISPETPDNTLTTAQKNKLDFYVLSDAGGKVARSFGLMFPLPADLVELYKGFGLDLAKANGSETWELPLAATYVVGRDGKIIYSFVDADYKKRAETTDVIAVLKRK